MIRPSTPPTSFVNTGHLTKHSTHPDFCTLGIYGDTREDIWILRWVSKGNESSGCWNIRKEYCTPPKYDT